MKKTQEPRENEKVFEKKKKIKVVWEGEKQLVVVSSIFKNLERTSHTGTDTHDVHSHTHTHTHYYQTRERETSLLKHMKAHSTVLIEFLLLWKMFKKKKRVVCFVVQVKPNSRAVNSFRHTSESS
jgi:hypothetical protein